VKILDFVYVGMFVSILMSTTSVVYAVEQDSDPQCQCREPGGAMLDLGTVKCIEILGTKKLLRCEMSTNTPYWNEVDDVEGCPAA
jgi:hypothetical protein